jgi:hypothetical protein
VERAPPYQPPAPDGEGGASGGLVNCERPPDIDDDDACDSTTVNLVQRRPTIYFVLDTSGSMLDNVAAGRDTKLEAAQTALRTVIKDIGHRINFGMATFPGTTLDEYELYYQGIAPGCEPGSEVVQVQAGDEQPCLYRLITGPAYRKFTHVLDDLVAIGMTPLAPTLDLIAPALLGREGQTTVVLLTDGHPNCSKESHCSMDECPLTGAYLECIDANCCSEEEAPPQISNPTAYCVDGPDSVQQVERLRTAGIDTYVIGLLGEADFDDVMNDLAEAGGHPKKGDRKYFAVEEMDELTEVMLNIGLTIAHSCSIELTDLPPNARTLNVYFDGEVVPSDPQEGWTIADDVVTLHGEACASVKSGQVEQVRLLSGCETILR